MPAAGSDICGIAFILYVNLRRRTNPTPWKSSATNRAANEGGSVALT